jgi:large subunit ribosomal protein L15
MITLSALANTHRPRKKVQRVGRGMGSKRGKTSCRGVKGDKARRGYERNYGREGGRKPLYTKLPIRGFNSGRFRMEAFAIDFDIINQYYKDGETVNYETLREKGIAPRRIFGGLKILASGEPKAKVTIEADAFSKAALEKCEKNSITCKVV